ncbi:MAG: caspase family protein [Planctomycetes bacterium]|nr:caspase family protein [Planctomycetota bacterium]
MQSFIARNGRRKLCDVSARELEQAEFSLRNDLSALDGEVTRLERDALQMEAELQQAKPTQRNPLIRLRQDLTARLARLQERRSRLERDLCRTGGFLSLKEGEDSIEDAQLLSKLRACRLAALTAVIEESMIDGRLSVDDFLVNWQHSTKRPAQQRSHLALFGAITAFVACVAVVGALVWKWPAFGANDTRPAEGLRTNLDGVQQEPLIQDNYRLPTIAIGAAWARQGGVGGRAIEVDRPKIQLEAVAKSPDAGPITGFQLLLDKVIVEPSRDFSPSATATLRWSFHMTPGRHTLTLQAKNAIGWGRKHILVHYLDPTQLPKLYVLCIGVPAPDGEKGLPFAVDDAKRIHRFFGDPSRRQPVYGSVHRKLLVNDEATQSNIVTALTDWASEMTSRDLLLIYYAGHGEISQDQLYLITHETKLDNLAGTGLSTGRLQELIGAQQARAIVLLDCCHAGGFGPLDPRRDNAKRMAVMCACSITQVAQSNALKRSGYFTQAIMEALTGARTSTSSSGGMLNHFELQAYLARRTAELTGSRQQATFYGHPDPIPLCRVVGSAE